MLLKIMCFFSCHGDVIGFLEIEVVWHQLWITGFFFIYSTSLELLSFIYCSESNFFSKPFIDHTFNLQKHSNYLSSCCRHIFTKLDKPNTVYVTLWKAGPYLELNTAVSWLILWALSWPFHYKCDGFETAISQSRHSLIHFWGKRNKEKRKDTEMAKANNSRAISLNLVLMLSLLIFISMAESRILSGKSYITA